jgi:hypothetical protein
MIWGWLTSVHLPDYAELLPNAFLLLVSDYFHGKMSTALSTSQLRQHTQRRKPDHALAPLQTQFNTLFHSLPFTPRHYYSRH